MIVGPLCPASLKRLVFYKATPSDKHSLFWLANWHSAIWLAENTTSRVGNVTPFTIIVSFCFQNKCEDS